MSTKNNKHYFAFISYKRQDEEWAKWFQNELENYHLPSTLNGRDDLPESFRPVFRDIDELKAGNLPEQIYNALATSLNLVVICSPRLADDENAKWVNKEISDFIEIGKKEGTNNISHIFPFIIEGNPHAGDESECFPKALRELSKEQERIGGNINEGGDVGDINRERAFVKVLAGMLPDSVGFDMLWNKYDRDKMERERKEKEERDKLLIAQSRFVAEKAMGLVETDSYLARILALEVLPKDLKDPDRPYSTGAEKLLRESNAHETVLFADNKAVCATYSPDGQFVAVAYTDTTIIIWDAKTGISRFGPLKGHTKLIKSLAYSPDGKMMVSASEDMTMILWDTNTGLPIGDPLVGHESGIACASFSPDGKYIVSASGDWTIRIWDVSTGDAVGKPLEGHGWGVNYAEFSPDGKHIVSCSNDRTIRVWDVATREFFILGQHDGSVFHVAYNPDGTKIASASMDGTVKIWDGDTAIQLKPEATSMDGTVKIWDANTIAWDNSFASSAKTWFRSVAFSHNGKMIATASTDQMVRIWNADDAKPFGKPFAFSSGVESVEFSPDDMRILCVSDTVSVCDVGRYAKPLLLIDGIADPDEISFPITSMIITDDSKHIIVEHFGETIVCDLETGERLCQPLDGYIKSASANGKRILLYSEKKKVARIWDVEQESFIGDTFDTEEVAISPDGNQVVFTSENENGSVIKVCDIESGKVLFCINDDGDEAPWIWAIRSYVFSPDSNQLLSITFDGDVKRWDVTEKKEGVRFIGKMRFDDHKSLPFYSPDGKYVVAIDNESDQLLVQTWSAESGTMLWGASYEDCSISISPNSKRLVAVNYSNDGSMAVVIIDISDGTIIKKHIIKELYNGFYYFESNGNVTYTGKGSFTFDSNGDILIVGLSKIIVINTLTGEIIQKQRKGLDNNNGHSIFYNSMKIGRFDLYNKDYLIDITPDEKYVLCASEGIVIIRDIETGNEIKSFKGNFRDVHSIAFTPNGRKIVATYDNGIIRIWDFPPLQDLIDQTRERFKDRPLTPEERRQYYLE